MAPRSGAWAKMWAGARRQRNRAGRGECLNTLKVRLAVNAHRDLCAETARCLFTELRQEGAELAWDVELPDGDPLVSRMRSEVVTRAILGRQDVLVWLDQDVAWSTGDLAGLVRRCAEVQGVVGGLVPFHGERSFGRGFSWRPVPGTRPQDVIVGTDRLVPADKVGGGFVAFWVPALARMVEALEKSVDPTLRVTRCRAATGFFWDACRPVAVQQDEVDALWSYLPEDWSLLLRLQACGVKAFAWTKPFLRRFGRKTYGAGDALGIAGQADDVEEHLRGIASLAEQRSRALKARRPRDGGGEAR